MRLKPDEIANLTRIILDTLEAEEYIEVLDEGKAQEALQHVISEELKKEENLDEEVKEILKKFTEKMDQDHIHYHEMFKMVKEKLAKERNIII